MRRLTLALAALWLAHCDREDVIVGEVPTAGAGGEGGAGAGGAAGEGPGGAAGQAGKGEPCHDKHDCAPLEFCQKATCAQDEVGECQPRPVHCSRALDERCGCDGVTYWNDCLRRQLGVTASRPGRCKHKDGATCAKPGDCPFAGASCALLVASELSCSDALAGICWLLPPSCPEADDGPAWERCDGSGDCDRLCEAIGSELPHRLRLGPSCGGSP